MVRRKRLRRLLDLVVMGCFALTLSTPPAFAAGSARINLSPRIGPPTSPFVVDGAGFQAQERVDVTFGGQLVRAKVADAHGSFSVHLHVPGSARPGSHLLVAI